MHLYLTILEFWSSNIEYIWAFNSVMDCWFRAEDVPTFDILEFLILIDQYQTHLNIKQCYGLLIWGRGCPCVSPFWSIERAILDTFELLTVLWIVDLKQRMFLLLTFGDFKFLLSNIGYIWAFNNVTDCWSRGGDAPLAERSLYPPVPLTYLRSRQIKNKR